MIPSPCIGYCRIDEASRLCAGCARTRSEIGAWRDASDEERKQIWAELPERRTKLGIGLHSLGWTLAQIHTFISGTLRAGAGTWVFGVYGAVAEFCIGMEDAIDLAVTATRISAATSRGAVCFELSEHIRALTLPTTGGSCSADMVILVLPQSRVQLLATTGLTACGLDRNALRPQHRSEALYDFGISIGAAGFGVRTGDTQLQQTLDRHSGADWRALLSSADGQLLRASPTRVVRSPIGRVEVYTPIPAPGGTAPAGPHTHFLPALLSMGRETPPGVDIPPAFVPCAIFYPDLGQPDDCA